MPPTRIAPWLRWTGCHRASLAELVELKRDELLRRGWSKLEFNYHACAKIYNPSALAEYRDRVLSEISDGTSESVMAGVLQVSRTHVHRYSLLSLSHCLVTVSSGGVSNAMETRHCQLQLQRRLRQMFPLRTPTTLLRAY